MIKRIKIEDRLWSFTYGWVSITKIDEEDCNYPIEACREGTFDYVTFTSTGAALSEGNQDLFWDELKFDIPEKPEPPFEQDELVMIRFDQDGSSYLRHAAFYKEGTLHVYAHGLNSVTACRDKNGYPNVMAVFDARSPTDTEVKEFDDSKWGDK